MNKQQQTLPIWMDNYYYMYMNINTWNVMWKKIQMIWEDDMIQAPKWKKVALVWKQKKNIAFFCNFPFQSYPILSIFFHGTQCNPILPLPLVSLLFILSSFLLCRSSLCKHKTSLLSLTYFLPCSFSLAYIYIEIEIEIE